jgi:hypothetical protein
MSEPIKDLVLIAGASASGKSASLMNLENHEGVMYLNCESGKRLPFPNKFKKFVITDPLQIYEAFDAAEGMPDIHTIVVDSITFLMDMFESLYVVGSTNTMKGWADYNQFFKNLMQDKVAKSTKRVIFTAHTLSQLNENEMVIETKIPIKGALKNQGIEAYFTCIVYAKKMQLKHLKAYQNDLLVITEEEELLGYKHVFQTCITKDTVHERIRSPRFMWKMNESFIDNDVTKVLGRINEFYEE